LGNPTNDMVCLSTITLYDINGLPTIAGQDYNFSLWFAESSCGYPYNEHYLAFTVTEGNTSVDFMSLRDVYADCGQGNCEQEIMEWRQNDLDHPTISTIPIS